MPAPLGDVVPAGSSPPRVAPQGGGTGQGLREKDSRVSSMWGGDAVTRDTHGLQDVSGYCPFGVSLQ